MRRGDRMRLPLVQPTYRSSVLDLKLFNPMDRICKRVLREHEDVTRAAPAGLSALLDCWAGMN